MLGDDTEATAVVDVQRSEIEGQQEERSAIDDHHFAVRARDVSGCPSHSDSGCRQTHLQLPQAPLAAAIRICDESLNQTTAAGGRRQSSFHFRLVETENENLVTLFGAVNRFDDRTDAVAGLNQKFHEMLPLGRNRLSRAAPTLSSTFHMAFLVPFQKTPPDLQGVRMYKKKHLLSFASMVVVLSGPAIDAGKKKENAATGAGEITASTSPVLWREPTDIASRN